MALTYRATNLRNLTSARRWFGMSDSGVRVRGTDVTIPGKDGRTAMSRVADYREIRLHGFVLGTDEANWRSERATVDALFDPLLTPGTLVDDARTIDARVDSVRTVDVVPELVTEYEVILHAIGDPPDWVAS